MLLSARLNDDCWRAVCEHIQRKDLFELRLVDRRIGTFATDQVFRCISLDQHQFLTPWPHSVQSITARSQSIVVHTTFRHIEPNWDSQHVRDALFDRSVEVIHRILVTPLASTLRTLVMPFSFELCEAIANERPRLQQLCIWAMWPEAGDENGRKRDGAIVRAVNACARLQLLRMESWLFGSLAACFDFFRSLVCHRSTILELVHATVMPGQDVCRVPETAARPRIREVRAFSSIISGAVACQIWMPYTVKLSHDAFVRFSIGSGHPLADSTQHLELKDSTCRPYLPLFARSISIQSLTVYIDLTRPLYAQRHLRWLAKWLARDSSNLRRLAKLTVSIVQSRPQKYPDCDIGEFATAILGSVTRLRGIGLSVQAEVRVWMFGQRRVVS